MADVKEFDLMVSDDEMDIDPEAIAAIEEGIRAADEGRVHSSEKVRKLVKDWSIGLNTPLPR
jgi:predicted transcriptional regulator